MLFFPTYLHRFQNSHVTAYIITNGYYLLDFKRQKGKPFGFGTKFDKFGSNRVM